MKKIGLLLLSAFTTLAITGCGGKTDTGDSWPDEVKNEMEQIIGEALPYVELAAGYQHGIAEDADGQYFYLTDESTVNLLGDYGNILTKGGYQYHSVDTEEGYEINFYTKGNIVVQYDFFPGTTEYAAGNEIYAWVENGGGDVDPGQTTLTAWPSELETLLTNTVGTTIPFVALAANFAYGMYDEETVYIYDETSTNYLSTYGNTLVSNGFALADQDSSYGYDIYLYQKDLNEDYSLLVQYDFFPGTTEYAAGNEIYVYLNPIIKETTSDVWPAEEIATLLGANCKVTVPSFMVNDSYHYYYYEESLEIYGAVSSDISMTYQDSALANGFLVGTTLDFNTWETVDYLYDWEEYVTVFYAYSAEDGIFAISITPSEPLYDELLESFPSDRIQTFLGETATVVPTFMIPAGQTYKFTQVAGDEPYLEIGAVDAGTIGQDAIEDTYKALLEAENWKIDASNYDDTGYVAISEAGDVKLTFYTYQGAFVLYVEGIVPLPAGAIDLTTLNQVTINTASQVVYQNGNVSVTIDKASSSTNANNYLGGNQTYTHTRVYKGQTLTFTVSEGTLSTITIQCMDGYATGFSEATATQCSVVVNGSTVTITPDENATSCSISFADIASKHVRMTSIVVETK